MSDVAQGPRAGTGRPGSELCSPCHGQPRPLTGEAHTDHKEGAHRSPAILHARPGAQAQMQGNLGLWVPCWQGLIGNTVGLEMKDKTVG